MNYGGSVVPYRNTDKLEEIAKNYLESFDEGLLKTAQETKIIDFVESHLQLGFQVLPISPDGKTLGYIVFKPTELLVFIGNDKEQKSLYIDKPTVVVDTALSDNDKTVGRFRFTCAHEAAHWILHRDVFFEGLLFDNADILTDKYDDGGQKNISHDKRMEWQANYLGAALLMPKVTVIQEFNRIAEAVAENKKISSHFDYQGYNPSFNELVINRLKDVYKVSEEAARIRLKQLGLLDDVR